MRTAAIVAACLCAAIVVGAQTPPPGQRAGAPPQTPAPAPQRQGGQGGRGGVQGLSLSTSAWVDGGVIPLRYTQAGEEVSPPLTWAAPPDSARSFLLIVHDIDAVNSDGAQSTLHWMVWNLPASSRGLPQAVPQGAERADGSRQISVTGPNYRGPAAPATGPEHHYLFELYALDTALDVPAVGQSVAQTRAAIIAAMAGHVVAKGTLVGRFRYPGGK